MGRVGGGGGGGGAHPPAAPNQRPPLTLPYTLLYICTVHELGSRTVGEYRRFDRRSSEGWAGCYIRVGISHESLSVVAHARDDDNWLDLMISKKIPKDILESAELVDLATEDDMEDLS